DPTEAARAAHQQAHRRGKALGAALRTEHHPDLVAALHGLGFEPEPASGRVLLHNCPFHALAARHTSLVCGLNHAFLAGLLDGPACSPSASAATARVLSRGSPSRQAAQLTTTSSTQVRQARSASGNALVSAPTSQSRRCEPPGPTRVSRPASTRVG